MLSMRLAILFLVCRSFNPANHLSKCLVLRSSYSMNFIVSIWIQEVKNNKKETVLSGGKSIQRAESKVRIAHLSGFWSRRIDHEHRLYRIKRVSQALLPVILDARFSLPVPLVRFSSSLSFCHLSPTKGISL